MSEHTAQRLLTEVLAMKGEVLLVKSKTKEIHTRLFGNGQPGELATLEKKLNEHSDWITRADEREKTNRKWTAAISSGCGAIIGAAAGWVAKHFGG